MRRLGKQIFHSTLEGCAAFTEEARTLSKAMQIVNDKLALLAPPGRLSGPVYQALEAHPGALERVAVGLAGRLEQYLEEAQALRARHVARHSVALRRCRLSVQLWVHRQDLGAPTSARKDARCRGGGAAEMVASEEQLNAGRVLLAALEASEVAARLWGEDLAVASSSILERTAGGRAAAAPLAPPRLPAEPPAFDLQAALLAVEGLLDASPRRGTSAG